MCELNNFGEPGATPGSKDLEMDLRPVLGRADSQEFRVMGLCQLCPVYLGSRILKHSDVCFTCGSTVKMVLYNSR